MRSWSARACCTVWKLSSKSNTQSWKRAARSPLSRAKSRRPRAGRSRRRSADEIGDEIGGCALADYGRRSGQQAGAHHADELAERHRLGEQITLPDVAAD